MTGDLIPYFSLFLILLSTLELLVGTRLRRMMIALAIMYLGQLVYHFISSEEKYLLLLPFKCPSGEENKDH